MHTFCNTGYEEKRHELLNRPNPIAVSDIKHEYEIKDQLDSDNIVDYQDKEEIFNC
jgi:hypothetical protein